MYPIDILPISPENIIALFLKFRNRKIINEIINEIIKISGTKLYDLLVVNGKPETDCDIDFFINT